MPFFIGCFGGAVFFRLMSRALFDDAFRLRLRYFGLLVLAESLHGGRWLINQGAAEVEWSVDLAAILLIAHQLLSLTMIVAALLQAQLGRAADMVEARRRFRGVFVGISGVYSLIVVATELYFRAQAAGPALELLNVGVIFPIVFSFVVAMTQLRPELRPAVVGAAPAVLDVPPHDVDEPLLGALRRLMEESKEYRQDDLTIGGLADQLGTQEYLLRRIINNTLGFRNFNEFLNRYRLAEVRGRLTDPAYAHLPILTIAMDCGFASLGPFNRAFKQTTGMTPSEFRRQHQESPSKKP